jgi:hypothetical protein
MEFEEGVKYTVTFDNTAMDVDGINLENYVLVFTTKINSPPVLEGGGVHPEEGDTSDTFKFSIIYTDEDDDEPKDVYVVIDDIPWRMLESDPKVDTYKEGKAYEYSLELEGGKHEYYFEVTNEKHEVRFPEGVTTKTVEVSEVEPELIMGIFEEEYAGLPTMICGPIGIILIVVIIIALVMMRRNKKAPRGVSTFQAFQEQQAAPMAFTPADEDLMSFTLDEEEEFATFQPFEEPAPLEAVKPVVIQCPECRNYLKVRATKRPFNFPCKCGASLVLR